MNRASKVLNTSVGSDEPPL
ncbi:hypothetical protein D018_1787A, partial [Vibrio parahaemolyticus VP2007-007]